MTEIKKPSSTPAVCLFINRTSGQPLSDGRPAPVSNGYRVIGSPQLAKKLISDTIRNYRRVFSNDQIKIQNPENAIDVSADVKSGNISDFEMDILEKANQFSDEVAQVLDDNGTLDADKSLPDFKFLTNIIVQDNNGHVITQTIVLLIPVES